MRLQIEVDCEREHCRSIDAHSTFVLHKQEAVPLCGLPFWFETPPEHRAFSHRRVSDAFRPWLRASSNAYTRLLSFLSYPSPHPYRTS